MKSRKTIITMGDQSEIGQSAPLLGAKFHRVDASEVTVADFNSKSNCFDVINDISEILVLGHGSREEYGNFSPKEFAAAFRKKFEASKSKQSKSAVKDIYLVGCQIGLIDEKGNSPAQDMVNALVKEGFVNLKLHCISANQVDNKDELSVNVIVQDKIGQLYSGLAQLRGCAHNKPIIEPGHIHASLEHPDNSKDIVVIAVNPRVELDKPRHIFIAGESPAQRMKRIEQDTNLAETRTREETISFLQRRMVYLNNKGLLAKLKAGKVNSYILKLQKVVNASDVNWHQAMGEIIQSVENDFSIKSNTRKLILNLSNRNSHRASEIVEGQRQKQSDSQVAGVIKRIISNRGSETAGKDVPEARHEVNHALSNDLRDQIKEHKNRLKDEISALSSNCFSSFFRSYEINTKKKKLDFLKSLKNAGTSQEVRSLAESAQQDSRVMRSRRKPTFTVNIINHILDETSESHASSGNNPKEPLLTRRK